MEKKIGKSPASYTLYPTRLLYLTRGIDRLVRLGVREKYPRNRLIIDSESIPSCCYLVLSGKVMAYEDTAAGNMTIYSFMEAGSILLECNTLMKKPALVNFRTTADSELVRIPRETLLKAMEKDPAVMMDIIESMSYKFFGTTDQLRQNYNHGVSWRICNLLLIYADRHGVSYDGKILIKEKLTQQTLASLLSANRITVVREIGNLKDLGLIEQINGFYCIRDAQQLRSHMELLN